MSAIYRVQALSLKKTKLGESDLIVTFLAEDGCQVRAVAKGARKTKSRFGSRVEPFTVVDLMLARGRSLDIVTEAQCVATHDALRGDLDRMSAASVVVDFLDKISVECQTEERLFALSTTTLDVMELAEVEDLRALVVAFLVKGMAMHGYRPQLTSCAGCAASIRNGDFTLFSMSSGGVVCADCAGADTSTVRVSADVPDVLNALLGARMADVGALGIPDRLLRDSLTLLRTFISYHVPMRMKALDMYGGGVL
ncbi:MAG: DNA repair protein RecO [Coriobacteriia bacterium]|nr:DNA repair protein RecO [Coriobacteriia bacterium]MBN2822683.1 DNA repair protein RecO [Coriobacteriia bacterium]